MTFRAYDILTQIIPGIFFTVIITGTTDLYIFIEKFELSNAILLMVICFIIGYVINTIGQILESLIVGNKINDKVRLFTEDKKVFGKLKIFKKFTKLRYIKNSNHNSEFKNFSNYFDNLITDNHNKISWLNEDKKFARSVVSLSILLIVFSVFITKNKFVNEHLILFYGLQFILLFIGIYRYFQSSIDYAFWVIKLSCQNSHLESKKNE